MPFILKPALFAVMSLVAVFVGHSLVQPAHESSGLPAASPNQAHYRGGTDAPVTVVVYVDYACPPCAKYNLVLNEVLQRYGDKIRLESRHYPLMTIHPNALRAAVATEAAGEQGHFWEMHDFLLSSQQQWVRAADPETEFAGLAAKIGLNVDRFRQAVQSSETRQRITNDITTGRGIGVEAVPSFFINGRRIQTPPLTTDEFAALIDAELRTKSRE